MKSSDSRIKKMFSVAVVKVLAKGFVVWSFVEGLRLRQAQVSSGLVTGSRVVEAM